MRSFGTLAQLVEHRPFKPRVERSSRSRPTYFLSSMIVITSKQINLSCASFATKLMILLTNNQTHAKHTQPRKVDSVCTFIKNDGAVNEQLRHPHHT